MPSLLESACGEGREPTTLRKKTNTHQGIFGAVCDSLCEELYTRVISYCQPWNGNEGCRPEEALSSRCHQEEACYRRQEGAALGPGPLSLGMTGTGADDSGVGPACALSHVEQQPWPLLARCQWHLLPSRNNQACLQTVTNAPMEAVASIREPIRQH